MLVGAPSRPVAGNTVVVQGAPGAGKTVLLREAARRYEAMAGRMLALLPVATASKRVFGSSLAASVSSSWSSLCSLVVEGVELNGD